MKITCEYCGNTFNDTEEKCPFCGSPNANVVRTTKEQPLTIEELAEWYKSKGLPPYETTRFFIGIDYKKPRAFGIYKDPETDEYVVYKNKDSGERAVRYRGTDQAYAVNELFMRLKQEIIQQKMNNAKKGSTGGASRQTAGNIIGKSASSLMSVLLKIGLYMVGLVVGGFLLLALIGVIVGVVENEPYDGYYSYQDRIYYYDGIDYKDDYYNWYCFDDAGQEWTGPIYRDDMDAEMRKNKTAKAYFLQSNWSEDLGCNDFLSSTYAADLAAGFYVAEGYYNCDGNVYYHMDDYYDSGWYSYDDGSWSTVNSEALPVDLQHSSEASDFYYTPDWDSSTQITDFTDTQEYQDEVEARSASDEDSDYSDDSDYSWDSSSDSWDSGSSDWDSDW